MANEGEDEPLYNGDAYLLPGRIERLEQQAADSRKREQQYREEQLTTNRRIAQFTGLLVLCTLATAGVAMWQAHISNKAANAARQAAQAAIANNDIASSGLTENERASKFTLQQMAAQSESQARAATASQRAVKNAQDAFRDEQLAWLGPLGTAPPTRNVQTANV